MTGVELIAKERARQITDEGWSREHDEQYSNNELVYAAMSYLKPVKEYVKKSLRFDTGDIADPSFSDFEIETEKDWPFDPMWWKPSPDNRVKELVKAGALIAAEIDRLLGEKENNE